MRRPSGVFFTPKIHGLVDAEGFAWMQSNGRRYRKNNPIGDTDVNQNKLFVWRERTCLHRRGAKVLREAVMQKLGVLSRLGKRCDPKEVREIQIQPPASGQSTEART
jgi:hypothetical protein